jgi:hypothetical protein
MLVALVCGQRHNVATMTQTQALIFVLCGWGLPLLHVLLAPGIGGWRPPQGSNCPIGHRFGWLVLVLLLGPIGWLMFVTRKSRKRRVPPAGL